MFALGHGVALFQKRRCLGLQLLELPFLFGSHNRLRESQLEFLDALTAGADNGR